LRALKGIEHHLQKLASGKRFLQDRPGTIRLHEVGRAIGGDKDIRQTAGSELIGNGIDQLAGDIEIEHRGLHRLAVKKLKRLGYTAGGADDSTAKFHQHVLELERDQSLVLDDEDPKVLELRDVLRIVHRLFAPGRNLRLTWFGQNARSLGDKVARGERS